MWRVPVRSARSPTSPAREVRELLFGLAQFRLNHASPRDKRPAGRCRYHAMLGALYQSPMQFIFELPETLCDCRR